ncbi:MAG: hypothetical protein H7644_02690 [Candidatus Heimdallarchaeota archaeon]|nr:hypothetical protein [Candidatus Heimdallarchaeota archaeon]MCK5142652.1 hypothetical protein [Candidatus Heimdallarchaeota archaeon]
MPYFLRKIWNDSIFQGKNKKRNYFEGWYFKIINSAEDEIYAIIPGISYDKDGNGVAFVQFFNGINAETTFFEFDISAFKFSKKEFSVEIGENYFSSKKIKLNLSSKKKKVEGEIGIGELVPWSKKKTSLGVMGWYKLVPFMECYHGVLGFDHSIEGELSVNGKKIDFTNGKGYMEKDYGKSFPHYYIWMQSNTFDKEGVSLMASFAKIPWLGSAFDGYLVGFRHNKKLYRFTTYTGAKVTKLQLKDKEIIFHVTDKKYRIEITAFKSKAVNLHSPVDGSMVGRILESLTSEIKVRLIELNKKERESILFEGTGRNAGLDIGGRVEEIKEIS